MDMEISRIQRGFEEKERQNLQRMEQTTIP